MNSSSEKIEDFVKVIQRIQTGTDDSQRYIEVFGDPLHLSAREVADKYSEIGLEKFLSYEARYSVGNYVLLHFDGSFVRLITSPGYSGGYFFEQKSSFVISSTLDNILKNSDEEITFDDSALAFLFARQPVSNFKQLPFSSIFEGVSRLQPSAVLEVRDIKKQKYYSYLFPKHPLDPPKSLEDALEEVFTCIVSGIKSKGRKAGVLFSSGADCLIMALYFREMMPSQDIRILTMHHTQHSLTNGPMRAFPMMKALGMDIEYGEGDYLHSAAAADYSLRCMKRDHTHARGPHLGCIEMGVADTDIMTGQNMDSIMNIGMTITPKTLEKGYFSPHLSGNKELNELRAFASNIIYTREYSGNRQIQNRYKYLLRDSVENSEIDPDLGVEGIIRGMFSVRIPNLIMKDMRHVDGMGLLNRELDYFTSFTEGKGLDFRYAIDLASHVSWNQLAHKRLSTLPLENNSRVALPANSGPMLSYYMGKKRGIGTALAPKNELYSLIQKMAGTKYSRLFRGADPEPWRRNSSPDNSFVRHHKKVLLESDRSVLDLIGNASLKSHLTKVYRKMHDLEASGAAPTGPCPSEMALIFLEQITSNLR